METHRAPSSSSPSSVRPQWRPASLHGAISVVATPPAHTPTPGGQLLEGGGVGGMFGHVLVVTGLGSATLAAQHSDKTVTGTLGEEDEENGIGEALA